MNLADRIKAARPGDAIELSEDEPLAIVRNVAFDPPVTVRPALGATVTIAGLFLSGCDGVAFEDLAVRPIQRPDPARAITGEGTCVYVGSCKNVTLDGLDVGNPGAAEMVGTGIMVRGSQGVAVRACEIHDMVHGMSHLDNDGLEIASNRFHDLWGDGLRGGGSDNVVIRANHWSRFRRPEGDTNHPDACQFWTTNTTEPAVNILVEGNVIDCRDGTSAQGVFIGNERSLIYENVTVRGNICLGTMWNSVCVGGAADPLVEDNFCLDFTDTVDGAGRTMTARVMLRRCIGGRVRNNVANAVMPSYEAVSPATVDEGNVVIPVAQPGDISALEAWKASRAPASAPAEAPEADPLAELRAQLAAAQANDAQDAAEIAALKAERDHALADTSAAQSQTKATAAVLEIVRADREEDRAAMVAASARADEARAVLSAALATYPEPAAA